MFSFCFRESQALEKILKSLKGMSLDSALDSKGSPDAFKAQVASLVAPVPKEHVGGMQKAVKKFRDEIKKIAKKANKKNKAGDGAAEPELTPLHKMMVTQAHTLGVGESIGLVLTRAEFNAGRGPFISAMDVRPYRDLVKTPGMALFLFWIPIRC